MSKRLSLAVLTAAPTLILVGLAWDRPAARCTASVLVALVPVALIGLATGGSRRLRWPLAGLFLLLAGTWAVLLAEPGPAAGAAIRAGAGLAPLVLMTAGLVVLPLALVTAAFALTFRPPLPPDDRHEGDR